MPEASRILITAAMQLIAIDHPDDPRVNAYRNIRERDLTGREGRFIAEGRVVLNVLFGSKRFEVESLLVLENRLTGISDLLAEAPADLPVFVASRPVIDAIAGFPLHRGILGIGKKGAAIDAGALLRTLPSRALVLALVGIANHDNMGAIFRNAAALGADAILLDDTCCDPFYRKAIRVSVGAVLKVPCAVAGKAADVAAMLDREGFQPLALSPHGATDLRDVSRSERTALFLGTEGDGLPASLLSSLRTVRIAMAPGFDSLNVAAASAIALHHLQAEGSSRAED